MSGTEIFLDTNILIYLLKGNQDVAQLLNGKSFVISFVTELELLCFPAPINQMEEIKKLLGECRIVDINSEIKNLIPRLRIEYKLKLPDAIICATSIYLKLPLLTSDKHFANIGSADILMLEL